MNIETILLLISKSSAIIAGATKGLELLKGLAKGVGANDVAVQAAVDRGRAAADAADAVGDRIIDRLDREGK